MTLTDAKKGKRKTSSPCQGCFLHLQHCICNQLYKIKNQTHVDLLVHYKELKRTSNSGRLISKTLEHQKIWIRGRKGTPLDHGSIVRKGCQTLLLYPSDGADVLSSAWLQSHQDERPFQLLVPDGNWRQASKVHYRVEALKHIPRVTLPAGFSDTESLLRLENKENGMSTLEAIGHALGVLDGPEARDHLLSAYQVKKKAVLKARGVL